MKKKMTIEDLARITTQGFVKAKESTDKKIDNLARITAGGFADMEKRMGKKFKSVDNRLDKVEGRLDRVEVTMDTIGNRMDRGFANLQEEIRDFSHAIKNRIEKIEKFVGMKR